MDIQKDDANASTFSQVAVNMKRYSFHSPNLQQFSLSRNIIYYILKNPNGTKGYQNLMKSCKYFYSKNPIIFVDTVTANANTMTWIHSCKRHHMKVSYIMKLKCKVWICEKLDIYCELPPFVAFKKFIHVTHLYLYKIYISFDTFLIFTNFNQLKKLGFYFSSVKYSNGIPVADKKFFELFPKLKNIRPAG